MAEPTQEEIELWLKQYPREVSKFATKSHNLRSLSFDKSFYSYGIKVKVTAKYKETWTPKGQPPSGIYTTTVHPGKIFSITPILTLNTGVQTSTSAEYVEVKAGYNGRQQYSAIVFGTPKPFLKKIDLSISGEIDDTIDSDVFFYYGYDDYGRWRRLAWWWSKHREGTFSVDYVSVYEHPYIDSGMRIAGTNGKVYTPAETVFPSPLRIFHNRVRNIMLVPINTQFASVFKINTKDGIQAITTLS